MLSVCVWGGVQMRLVGREDKHEVSICVELFLILQSGSCGVFFVAEERWGGVDGEEEKRGSQRLFIKGGRLSIWDSPKR